MSLLEALVTLARPVKQQQTYERSVKSVRRCRAGIEIPSPDLQEEFL